MERKGHWQMRGVYSFAVKRIGGGRFSFLHETPGRFLIIDGASRTNQMMFLKLAERLIRSKDIKVVKMDIQELMPNKGIRLSLMITLKS